MQRYFGQGVDSVFLNLCLPNSRLGSGGDGRFVSSVDPRKGKKEKRGASGTQPSEEHGYWTENLQSQRQLELGQTCLGLKAVWSIEWSRNAGEM